MEPPPPSPPKESLRLPGTYATHYEGDPSPGRGGVALLALIALDTLGVLFELYRFLSTGRFEALLISGQGTVSRFRMRLGFHGDLAGEHWEIDSFYIAAE